MGSEAELQKQILDYLTANGDYAVNVMKASKAGVPDILACIGGTFVGIEVKVGLNTVSPLQLYNLANIEKAGGIAIAVYNLRQVEVLASELRRK